MVLLLIASTAGLTILLPDHSVDFVQERGPLGVLFPMLQVFGQQHLGRFRR